MKLVSFKFHFSITIPNLWTILTKYQLVYLFQQNLDFYEILFCLGKKGFTVCTKPFVAKWSFWLFAKDYNKKFQFFCILSAKFLFSCAKTYCKSRTIHNCLMRIFWRECSLIRSKIFLVKRCIFA